MTDLQRADGEPGSSQARHRPAKGRRRFIRLLTIAVAIVVGTSSFLSLASVLVVGLMNAEYRTRAPEMVTLQPKPNGRADELGLVLRLRLLGFDESTGRVNAQLLAYTRNNELRRQLETDVLKVYVSITDGMSTNSIADVARARLIFSADTIPNIAYGISESNILEIKPIFLMDVSIFPFDTYRARLLIWLASSAGNPPPFAVEVEKSYFNRTLSVDGTPDEVKIAAARPFLDRTVVIGSSVIFLLCCTLVAVALFFESGPLSGFEGAIALAGFLLSAIGFREFAGFTSLQSRSFLDVVVFLVPLAALFVVFGYRFVRGARDGVDENPS